MNKVVVFVLLMLHLMLLNVFDHGNHVVKKQITAPRTYFSHTFPWAFTKKPVSLLELDTMQTMNRQQLTVRTAEEVGQRTLLPLDLTKCWKNNWFCSSNRVQKYFSKEIEKLDYLYYTEINSKKNNLQLSYFPSAYFHLENFIWQRSRCSIFCYYKIIQIRFWWMVWFPFGFY